VKEYLCLCKRALYERVPLSVQKGAPCERVPLSVQKGTVLQSTSFCAKGHRAEEYLFLCKRALCERVPLSVQKGTARKSTSLCAKGHCANGHCNASARTAYGSNCERESVASVTHTGQNAGLHKKGRGGCPCMCRAMHPARAAVLHVSSLLAMSIGPDVLALQNDAPFREMAGSLLAGQVRACEIGAYRVGWSLQINCKQRKIRAC